MKYSVGEKHQVKRLETRFEILSIFPGAQRIQMTNNGITYYRILIDGNETLLSETVLDLLLSSMLQEPAKKSYSEPSKKKVIK